MCHLCIRILTRELQVRNLRIMMMMEMEVVMVTMRIMMIVTGVKAQRHLMPEVFLAGTRLMLWQGHSSA